jgi:hypothetical protein
LFVKIKFIVPLANPIFEKTINQSMGAYLIRGAAYLLLLLALCVIPFALAQRATAKGNRPANVITVTNTNDSGPGSLRQALADVNDGDTINFAVTGTIGLTSGELLVDKAITISGPGAENLTVNGSAKSTVFHVVPGETVTISGLTIINGYTTGSGGGIHNDHATLTLSNCTITGNQGGGIYNDAENSGGALLEINNSSVTENSQEGVYNDALGGDGVATLNVSDSSINNNYSGGAILSRGWLCTFCPAGTATVQITNSSITGNGSTSYAARSIATLGNWVQRPCQSLTARLAEMGRLQCMFLSKRLH